LVANSRATLSISWVRFLEACFGFFSGVIVAGMSDYRHKRHNVSSLIYHIVCPAKYRRVIFDAEVDTVLKDVCLDIAKRYEIAFLEIGTDQDHVHFLVQSVPSYSPTKIVKIIKSLTAREIFHRVPIVKKCLWGGELDRVSDTHFPTLHGMLMPSLAREPYSAYSWALPPLSHRSSH
jgi:REP-associated tyrosine transposase